MATTFTNRREAEAFIRDAINAYPELGYEIDVEAVASDLHQIAGGNWDIQHISHNIFWAAVSNHRKRV